MKQNGKERKKSIQELKGKIIPALRRNDVVQAGIFGSFARGESGKKSDIDILVKFKKGKSLLDLVGLKLELEKKTKRKVDLLTYDSVHPLLKGFILKEEVRIYEEG